MGRDLVLDTLRHKANTAVPWVPFAGIHAGKLKGYTAKEVLIDADKLYESLMEVNRLYAPDGMPVIFDLQVEAEILGCELLWASDNPPSVRSHPFAKEKGVPCAGTLPDAHAGRLPVILDVMRRLKAEIGDEVALYGLICGPFTLASHLRGSDMFMDMITDPEYVIRLIEYCGEFACRMSELYIEAGMDVIAVVDPLLSQISPKHSRQMLLKTYTALFGYIRSKGALSSLFVCGNATRQLEVMCETNPDGISVDENVDLAAAKKITDGYNITIGGNIPLTTTMLYGTQQDNMKYVVDLMDSVDRHNLIISPGCDMPYDIPIENAIAAGQAVKTPDDARAALKNYESASLSDIEITLPDYKNRTKALVEVFTLDPDQCAACTYMVNLVADNFGDIKDIADYAVYKYTVLNDIARTVRMGIKNLPTLCINGEQKWVSLIPGKEEFVSEVQKAYGSLNRAAGV